MTTKRLISTQTRNNWLVVFGLFIGGIIASLSGLYFLLFPTSGYKGGRNPWYGITILFDRHTWRDLHTWAGVIMIIIVLIHIPLHWKWIVNMAKKTSNIIKGQSKRFNARSKFNLTINSILGLSFIVTAITGLYFFFVPGSFHNSLVSDNLILFSKTTWKDIHTWSSIILIAMATTHLWINWKWITKVTKIVFTPGPQKPPISFNA
ncbi:MAG TPA: DUF4405 domain-containing protein [Anaerolineae bacterium]|nr:DUF4405 domain-containing protein [Anaerolineae bacterium]